MSKRIARNKKVFGVGINDYENSVCDENGKIKQSYRDWYNMLSRCYGNNKENTPTYEGCKFCDEWLSASNFINWHNNNYIFGFQLDKDILCKGNRLYSPSMCCFVPHEINSLFTKHQKTRGKYPIGVCKNTKRNGYVAKIWTKEGCVKKCFSNPDDAFLAYKYSKEMYIKYIADKYKDTISDKTYQAMYDYKVEITD